MAGGRAIWIGNDHGGFAMKRALVEHLGGKRIAVHDAGSGSEEIVRYPRYAAQVAEAVAAGNAERGILICTTGIGMSIIANKYKGVRASLCTNEYMGRMTRAHNDSNILCLGGKLTPVAEALAILDVWLETPYEGGRHDISLDLIREAEEAMTNSTLWKPR